MKLHFFPLKYLKCYSIATVQASVFSTAMLRWRVAAIQKCVAAVLQTVSAEA